MSQLVCFAPLRRLVESTLHAIAILAAIATGSMLLGASLPVHASVELFGSLCSGCHNNVVHPANLVYNAAGNAEILETLDALGMGASGSVADNISIATYLDTTKPTITLAKVAQNSPGTAIKLGDIAVSASVANRLLKIIEEIETVSPPTKGTVWYSVANGFAQPSIATYTPFPGQSGTDTWTYRGTGSRGTTTIRTASVIIAPGDDLPATNYQGLWWNSPAGSESGWGINFAHQGDTVFATWFTYDAAGNGMWLVMAATKTANGVYTGNLNQLTTGPAFDAVPFPSVGTPGGAAGAVVGTGTLTFTDPNNGSFAYTVNGISQTKAITHEDFGPRPTCTFVAQPYFALATNYQDLWWASPPGSESGWGINLTHQGDTIFASWFTYDHEHKPMWLVSSASKTTPNSYSGTLVRTTGPPFNAVPFPPTGTPGGATGTNVGTASFTFADGSTASFTYTVNGVTQTKNITRELFQPPGGTVCQ